MTGTDGVFEILNDADGLEGAGDDLGGPDTMRFVGQLGLKQFRVREDDAELVVQPMEEADDFWRHGVGGAR